MKQIRIRLVLICLILACCTGLLTGCTGNGGSGKALLTLDENTLSLNIYELLCSRMKGTLGRNQLNVSSADFWSTVMDKQNTTYDTYYKNAVLDTCKSYLAAMALFDELGLSLPQATYDEIDKTIADFLDYDANNSKSQFNSILSAYGVNMTMLREAYVMEEKVKYLESYLYGSDGSKIGDALCQEYCEEHYVRFKQIFLANYYYVYDKDKNGDEIWYTTADSKIAYDTTHGVTRSGMVDSDNRKIYYCNPSAIAYDTKCGVTVLGVNGQVLKDENNQDIYYTDETGAHIAYDSATGVTHEDADGAAKKDSHGDTVYYIWAADAYDRIAYRKTGDDVSRALTTNESGTYVTEKYTAEEIAAISKKANALCASLSAGDTGAFEGVIATESDDLTGQSSYADGYYLRIDKTYSLDYMTKIVAALQEMQPGEIRLVMAEDSGYHIIMKYEMNDGAYCDSDNSLWFQDFYSSLESELFANRIAPYLDRITRNEDVWKNAPSMSQIGTNYYY